MGRGTPPPESGDQKETVQEEGIRTSIEAATSPGAHRSARRRSREAKIAEGKALGCPPQAAENFKCARRRRLRDIPRLSCETHSPPPGLCACAASVAKLRSAPANPMGRSLRNRTCRFRNSIDGQGHPPPPKDPRGSLCGPCDSH